MLCLKDLIAIAAVFLVDTASSLAVLIVIGDIIVSEVEVIIVEVNHL